MQGGSAVRGWTIATTAREDMVVCPECKGGFYVSSVMWKAECPHCGRVMVLRSAAGMVTMELSGCG